MAAGAIEVMEVTTSAVDVLGDLFAERFNGGKLDLRANVLQEVDFDLGLGRKVDRMEVEEMSLDCE